MRRYELQFGTENEVDGGIVRPVYQEIIDAASDADAIEVAKASTMRATASAGNLAQLLDDRGAVVWSKPLTAKLRVESAAEHRRIEALLANPGVGKNSRGV